MRLMTHPYGEYIYSTRGLLSRGFMGGCEKKFSSQRAAIRACNQCCSAPDPHLVSRFAVGHEFSLRTAHSAEHPRDCLPPCLTLPAPLDGPRNAQKLAARAPAPAVKDRPAMRL